ncbi:MAG TPA: DUF1572 family protein [Pirellulaceae bacterium]|nr:DUF1572 family protein [Pirellulaceae bacterium]HMO92061.1 DUF1572 family protein [Pirellulaceae bacterium]HMP69937.1 DUF1572 family protein [Pirellulaceae bacterium]
MNQSEKQRGRSGHANEQPAGWALPEKTDIDQEVFLHQVCQQEFVQLLQQSWAKIDHCFSQLNEAQIWWRPDVDLNSIGNLSLHLAGNLRQWAVASLRGVPDERNRDAEFSESTQVSKQDLHRLLLETIADATEVICGIRADMWSRELSVQGFRVNVYQALQHTCAHFVGHTHQIILLTRLQLGDRYRFHWTPDGPREVTPI